MGLTFNGSCTHQGGGTGIILYDPDGTNICLSFKLEFSRSNKKSEYKVLIIGLIFAM